MGFFGDLWSKVKHVAGDIAAVPGKVWSKVKDAASGAGKGIEKVTSKVSHVVATVYDDYKGYVKGLGQFATNAVNKTTSVLPSTALMLGVGLAGVLQ